LVKEWPLSRILKLLEYHQDVVSTPEQREANIRAQKFQKWAQEIKANPLTDEQLSSILANAIPIGGPNGITI
jgi:hypothetical protein